MKLTLPLLAALLLAPPAALYAADAPAKAKPAVPPEFAPITDAPKLPRVLLMGDSVSIAYAIEVRKLLTGVANVHRVPANCGSTKTAFGSYGLVRWLPDASEKWDVIHFNHGLHDLSYRFADDSDRDKDGNYATPLNGGHQNVPPADYEKNLRQVVARLKQTGANLIFASTTPVPECDAGKYVKDAELPYNQVAKRVMADEGVEWNDLRGLVKPRQEELQGKCNVHFMPIGSSVMAKQVAEVIAAQLPKANVPTTTAARRNLQDDAAWLRERGKLLFHDAFDRDEDGHLAKAIGNGWNSATADRVPQLKQADLDEGVLKIASASEAAGHAAHIHHEAGFADGGAIVRFKFPGFNKGESLQVGFVDREAQGIHAGHLCYALLSQSSITLMDWKTGVMNLELRKRRQPYLDRKEPLPDELDRLLKSKQLSVPWKADNDWHELVLVAEGDEMRVSVDGKVMASHRSAGFAHPTKRWFSFLVPSTVWIDDVKIWRVK